jgi:hypothetical protein
MRDVRFDEQENMKGLSKRVEVIGPGRCNLEDTLNLGSQEGECKSKSSKINKGMK